MALRITITDTSESASFEVIRADHSPEATVTEHPVELGSQVSDHVQVLPLRLNVEVFVTASPRGEIPDPFAIEDAVGFFERALGKVATLILDGEGTFFSMVLEAFPHSRTNVGGRSFALRFKFVRVAASLSVAIPPRMPAPVAKAGAPSEQPLGQQAPTPGVPTSALAGGQDAVVAIAKGLLGF